MKFPRIWLTDIRQEMGELLDIREEEEFTNEKELDDRDAFLWLTLNKISVFPSLRQDKNVVKTLQEIFHKFYIPGFDGMLADTWQRVVTDGNIRLLSKKKAQQEAGRYLLHRDGQFYSMASSPEDLTDETEAFWGTTLSFPENIERYKELRVIGLWVRDKQLKLPEGLMQLPHLHTLIICDSELEEFPEIIYRLPFLEELHIHVRRSFNPLRPDWRRLSHIKRLSCSFELEDDIRALTGLEELSACRLPEGIEHLSKLKTIWGCSRYPKDYVIPESARKLTALESIHWGWEEWRSALWIPSMPWDTGLEQYFPPQFTFPEGFEHFEHLKNLDLSCRYLNEIPPIAFGMANLEELDLRFNWLHSISEDILKLKNLRFLDVRGNNITDAEAIVKLPGLEVLRTDDWLPAGLGEMAQLKELVTYAKLPERVGQLSNLEVLHLAEAEVIPDSIGQLSKLQILTLYSAENIPPSIGNLQNLRELRILPDSENGKNWRWTYFGEFPPTIWQLSRLEVLEIRVEIEAWEAFSLGLQHEKDPLPRLKVLNLSNSPMEKALESIVKFRELEELRVRNANLTHLPDAITQLSQLRYLDLSENQQLITLPENLGDMAQLQYLDLRNTGIKPDELPISLKNRGDIRIEM